MKGFLVEIYAAKILFFRINFNVKNAYIKFSDSDQT